jgi:hypothetical protein
MSVRRLAGVVVYDLGSVLLWEAPHYLHLDCVSTSIFVCLDSLVQNSNPPWGRHQAPRGLHLRPPIDLLNNRLWKSIHPRHLF